MMNDQKPFSVTSPGLFHILNLESPMMKPKPTVMYLEENFALPYKSSYRKSSEAIDFDDDESCFNIKETLTQIDPYISRVSENLNPSTIKFTSPSTENLILPSPEINQSKKLTSH